MLTSSQQTPSSFIKAKCSRVRISVNSSHGTCVREDGGLDQVPVPPVVLALKKCRNPAAPRGLNSHPHPRVLLGSGGSVERNLWLLKGECEKGNGRGKNFRIYHRILREGTSVSCEQNKVCEVSELFKNLA